MLSLVLPLFITSSAADDNYENPICKDYTMDTCLSYWSDEGIMLQLKTTRDKCETLCWTLDGCNFWAYTSREGAENSCLLYEMDFDDYIRACAKVAYPMTQEIVDDCDPLEDNSKCAHVLQCIAPSQTFEDRCHFSRYGECQVDESAMETLDFQTEDLCRQECQTMWGQNCVWYTYDRETGECLLYNEQHNKNCGWEYGASIKPGNCDMPELTVDQPNRYAMLPIESSVGGTCGEWWANECHLPRPFEATNLGSRVACQEFAGNLNADWFHYRTSATQGFTCNLYKGSLADALAECNIRGGPTDSDASETGECVVPDVATCGAYVDGDCRYTGTMIENENVESLDHCGQMCDANALCKAFSFQHEGKHCRNYDSTDRICRSHFGSGSKVPGTCNLSTDKICGSETTSIKMEDGFEEKSSVEVDACACQTACAEYDYWMYGKKLTCKCFNGQLKKVNFNRHRTAGGHGPL